MKLTKITDKGKAGNFDLGQNEILICTWNNGANPDFYAFDKSKNVRQIDREYFAIETVGEIYKKIEQVLPNQVHHYRMTKSKSGSLYFCNHQEGTIFGFDHLGNSTLIWNVELGDGHSIYDIQFQEPHFMWLAFPTGQTVTQVSLTEKKEIFRIGDYSWEDKSDPLSYQESIFIKNEFLYIPNMGSNKLFKVNMTTKEIELLALFDERLWQYGETDIGTVIITDTGLYEIEQW